MSAASYPKCVVSHLFEGLDALGELLDPVLLIKPLLPQTTHLCILTLITALRGHLLLILVIIVHVLVILLLVLVLIGILGVIGALLGSLNAPERRIKEKRSVTYHIKAVKTTRLT
jgi:hypothetical protein